MMTRDQAVNCFLIAFQNNDVDKIKKLLTSEHDYLKEIISLSPHGETLDWMAVEEHPVLVAAKEGKLDIVKCLVEASFKQEFVSSYNNGKYDLISHPLFSRNDVLSLKLIIYSLFPYRSSIELSYSELDCIDYIHQLVPLEEQKDITIYRLFTHACQNESLSLVCHFLKKLNNEIKKENIDYSDLRHEKSLHIINMEPNNKYYKNRALSTIIQGIFFAMKEKNMNIIQKILDNSDIVYLPDFSDITQDNAFVENMNNMLEKKRLFFKLDNDIVSQQDKVKEARHKI